MASNNEPHVPEFMTNENSSFGMKVRTMKFSPDDEEKMSKMTTNIKQNLLKKVTIPTRRRNKLCLFLILTPQIPPN